MPIIRLMGERVAKPDSQLISWRKPSRFIGAALAIDEQSFGPDHPNVGTDLNNLAALLAALTGWMPPNRSCG